MWMCIACVCTVQSTRNFHAYKLHDCVEWSFCVQWLVHAASNEHTNRRTKNEMTAFINVENTTTNEQACKKVSKPSEHTNKQIKTLTKMKKKKKTTKSK